MNWRRFGRKQSLNFLEVLRVTTENISEDDQCPSQDLNWETRKCSCRMYVIFCVC